MSEAEAEVEEAMALVVVVVVVATMIMTGGAGCQENRESNELVSAMGFCCCCGSAAVLEAMVGAL